MAMTTIPEMFVPTNMIILKGRINDKDINILLDTGASTSIISKKAVDKINLSDMVDTSSKQELQGIGSEQSNGRIWYAELNLNEIIFPISLIVSNIDFASFDMILGINFLQSYNAIIDFKHNKIKLNDKYLIDFSR
jgi:predicted aspartyl protease